MSGYYSNYVFKFDDSVFPRGKQNLNVGLTRMATDIHSQAVMRSPKLTRALANSGRFHRTGPFSYEVVFGGPRVPYARVREYFNNAHPWTRFYLKNSGDAVAANAQKYFENIL